MGKTDIDLSKEKFVANIEILKDKVELYTYESESFVKDFLNKKNISYKNFAEVNMGLEDAFIGLTGKY